MFEELIPPPLEHGGIDLMATPDLTHDGAIVDALQDYLEALQAVTVRRRCMGGPRR